LRRAALPWHGAAARRQLSAGARPDVPARARQAARGSLGHGAGAGGGASRGGGGGGSRWADLPRLDETVRDAWLADAPQPLAESIAALDGARNAHQARAPPDELARNPPPHL